MAQFTSTPPRSTSSAGSRAGAARHRRFRSLPNRDPVRERPGKATQSHLKAISKPYTRHRLRRRKPGAFVFPSCSLRILMVFSWYSHGILHVFLGSSSRGATAEGTTEKYVQN